MEITNSIVRYVADFYRALLDYIGTASFLNGTLFLVFDLFIVFVVINGILTYRDNKRWAPLRRDVCDQANHTVFLMFHAARSAMKRDLSYRVDEESIRCFDHFLREIKKSHEKLTKRLSLYGSGLGEKMLPQMAVINECCEEIIIYYEYSLMPFTDDPKKQQYYIYNSFNMQLVDKVIESLKELRKSHPRSIARKKITEEEGYDPRWIKAYFESLEKSDERIVSNVEDVNTKKNKRLKVLGTRELAEVIQSEKAKELSIETLRTF